MNRKVAKLTTTPKKVKMNDLAFSITRSCSMSDTVPPIVATNIKTIILINSILNFVRSLIYCFSPSLILIYPLSSSEAIYFFYERITFLREATLMN
jgi:hypothetical protein